MPIEKTELERRLTQYFQARTERQKKYRLASIMQRIFPEVAWRAALRATSFTSRFRDAVIDRDDIAARVTGVLFEHLLKAKSREDLPISIEGFAIGIARNLVFGALRREKTVSIEEVPFEASSAAATPQDSVTATIQGRAYLHELWEEIKSLPPRQAAALLLNFHEGGAGISLLSHVSIEEIAEILKLPYEQLLELWDRLPIDDTEIAEILGISNPQRVINLRKSARARLDRRLKPKD